MSMLERATNVIKQKVDVHGGSYYECLVDVPPNYHIDFVALGSIFIVNEQPFHFLHKESYTHVMCFIFG